MKKLLLLITGLLMLFNLEGQILRYSNYTAPTPPPGADTTGFHALITDGNTEGWYIAAADNFTLDGTSVSQWDDLSGNDNHLALATGDARPTWDSGNSQVTFDGTDDYLVKTISVSQPITIYMVVNMVNRTSNHYITNINYSTGYGVFQGAAGDSYVSANCGTTIEITNAVLNTYGILTVVFNGANSILQWNDETATTGNAGTDGANAIYMTYYENQATINVKEYIFRSAADDATTRALVKAYLELRNGL